LRKVSELRTRCIATCGECAAAERAGFASRRPPATHPFSSWIDQVIFPGERYKHCRRTPSPARELLLISACTFTSPCQTSRPPSTLMNMVRRYFSSRNISQLSIPVRRVWRAATRGLKSASQPRYSCYASRFFAHPEFPEAYSSRSATEHFLSLHRVKFRLTLQLDSALPLRRTRKSGGTVSQFFPTLTLPLTFGFTLRGYLVGVRLFFRGPHQSRRAVRQSLRLILTQPTCRASCPASTPDNMSYRVYRRATHRR